MPSLTDIANEVKAILDRIATNTAETADTAKDIKNNTAAANVNLSAINKTLSDGFVVVGDGLFALHEGQKRANSLLEANSEQNTAIICWLGNIADVLCQIMGKMNEQGVIQNSIDDSLDVMRRILELVHAREFVESQRFAAATKAIQDCCPPPHDEPEPCFEPCTVRTVDTYDPLGQEWAHSNHHKS